MPRDYGHPTLNAMFNALSKAGGDRLPVAQRTIYCDAMNTLLLHRCSDNQPYGNLPLYRVLLAFNNAGARVVVLSDERMTDSHPEVDAFLTELACAGLNDNLLRKDDGRVYIGAWGDLADKPCGVIIDNNQAEHHHRAHVYIHPADGILHDLQDAVAGGLTIQLPAYMKLER